MFLFILFKTSQKKFDSGLIFDISLKTTCFSYNQFSPKLRLFLLMFDPSGLFYANDALFVYCCVQKNSECLLFDTALGTFATSSVPVVSTCKEEPNISSSLGSVYSFSQVGYISPLSTNL